MSLSILTVPWLWPCLFIHWALGQKSWSCLLKSFTVTIIHPFHLLYPVLLGYWSHFVNKWKPLSSHGERAQEIPSGGNCKCLYPFLPSLLHAAEGVLGARFLRHLYSSHGCQAFSDPRLGTVCA